MDANKSKNLPEYNKPIFKGLDLESELEGLSFDDLEKEMLAEIEKEMRKNKKIR